MSDGPAASSSNTVLFILFFFGLILCSTMPNTKIDQPKPRFRDYRVHCARLHAISATCKRPIYLLYRNRAIDARKKKPKRKRATHIPQKIGQRFQQLTPESTGKKNHNPFRIPNGKNEFTRTIACHYYNKIKSDSPLHGRKNSIAAVHIPSAVCIFPAYHCSLPNKRNNYPNFPIAAEHDAYAQTCVDNVESCVPMSLRYFLEFVIYYL